MISVRSLWQCLALILVASVSWLQSSFAAHATLPGQNGPFLLSAAVPASGGWNDPYYWHRIYVVGLDGSSKPISPVRSTYYGPGISPDGKRIVFSKNPGDQLWLGARNDLTRAKQITFDSEEAHGAADPVFTPDGKAIYFTSWAEHSDTESAFRLARFWIKSGKAEYLTDTTVTNNSLSPAVSPNGKLIAYNTGDRDHSKIRIMRTDGSGSWVLDTPVSAFVGSFSPDGKRLVYTGRIDGGEEVFVSPVFGKGIKQLTFSGNLNYDPLFSPDASKIAFGMGFGFYSAIEILDLETGLSREIQAPGRYVAPTQWVRRTMFRIKGYSRSSQTLKLRVYNPGTIVLSGHGTKRLRVSTGSRRILKLRVRWRPRARRAKLTVGFKPDGALAGSRKVTIRR